MLWDKSSVAERVVVIWGLLIASVAVVYVAVSLSNLIFENSSNIASWVQALGSIIAIAAGFSVVQFQLKSQRKQDRITAQALLNTFGGAVNSVSLKLPRDGSRSQWDIRMMRVLLEAELARVEGVPLKSLSPDEQRGVFALRLAALQVLEALRVVEPELEEGNASSLVTIQAYNFLQEIIFNSQVAVRNGRVLLGDYINVA